MARNAPSGAFSEPLDRTPYSALDLVHRSEGEAPARSAASPEDGGRGGLGSTHG